MPKNLLSSTVYIDPPQFTTNPRKLDIRVEDVRLYGAKQLKPLKKKKRKKRSKNGGVEPKAKDKKRRTPPTIRIKDIIDDPEVLKPYLKIEKHIEKKIRDNLADKEIRRELELVSSKQIDDEDPMNLTMDSIVPTRLIVGFDTEYVPRKDVKAADLKGLPKEEILKRSDEFRNTVLSYQYYAILPGYFGKPIKEWSGILYVNEGERLSRSQFISAVYMKGFQEQQPDERNYVKIKRLPRSVLLVGHFNKVDLPAFSDFKDFKQTLDNIRKSMITVIHDPKFAPVTLANDKTPSRKKVYFLLRDTYLLTSSVDQSLAAIGKLLKIPKIKVSQKDYEDMRGLMQRDRKHYEDYAIRDAEIAAKYAYGIYCNQGKIGLRRDVPPTLSGMGVGLLLKYWTLNYQNPKQIRNLEMPRRILGDKIIEDMTFVKNNKKSPEGYYRPKNVPVDEDLKHWYTDFSVDCYHGGRNEQYFFGPGEVGHWFDYDLRSAYPTAMSLIPRPDWQKVHEVQDPSFWKVCEPDDLAFFSVRFKFPDSVRFPVLPIRTQYGLIYPLEGESCCMASEIVAARNLGAEITQMFCVKIECDKSDRPFKDFISFCIERRNEHPKDSLERLVWKEMTNGTYGKLAQGLRLKRAYNLKEDKTATFNESKITNSFFAAFTTGFVRAALGEIMNRLPNDVAFSNCTTDGILCTAPISRIKKYLDGPVGGLFHSSAVLFHGEKKLETTGFLEVKSEIKQPLGWKTRGQATLQPLTYQEKVFKESNDIVLAKAGISTPRHFRESEESQNEWMIDTFLDRNIFTKFEASYQASTRRIAQFDWDAISFYQEKYLNMEYDWKRCPTEPIMRSIKGRSHLYFDTKPWRTLTDFLNSRGAWMAYFHAKRHNQPTAKNQPPSTESGVLKTIQDFNTFLNYRDGCTASMSSNRYSVYLKRKYVLSTKPHNGLRIELCTAYTQGLMGFPPPEKRPHTYPKFSAFLNEAFGDLADKTTRSDVENGKRRRFVPHSITKNEQSVMIIEKLKVLTGINFNDSELWA